MNNAEKSLPNENNLGKIIKRIVFMRAVFLKIGEIDTVKECFSAKVLLESRWREAAFDKMDNQLIKKNIDWGRYWNPMLKINNEVGDLKESVSLDVYWNDCAEGMVLEKRIIKGNFSENLELWNFPFDAQDLSISIISRISAAEVELRGDSSHLSSMCNFVFVDEQEWQLDTKINSIQREMEDLNVNEEKEILPVIDFFCVATRRTGYFLWNIFLVLFLICTIAFTTFSIVHTKTENRLQLSFLLLLTTVSFRVNVNNNLPKISYLTLMDKWIIYIIIIQFIICIWHAIVGGALNCIYPCLVTFHPNTSFYADKIFFGILFTLFIISVIGFSFYVYYELHGDKRKKRMTYNEQLIKTDSKKQYLSIRSASSYPL